MAEMLAGARAFIDAPPVEPLGGGALSVARVIDTSGHELMGAMYESDACATVEEWAEWCTMNPVARKVFDNDTVVIEGDPFAVYAGVACHLQRIDEAKTAAENRLSLGESRFVDSKIVPLLDDAAVTIPGGPYPMPLAIGLAEAHAAMVYSGKPMLLVPRELVSCGASNGAIRASQDGSLTTVTGARVAPITVAPDVSGPITGTIYVTGSITLLRSPVASISVPQQPFDDGTYAPARALAERIYVPLFECLVAKVEATCS